MKFKKSERILSCCNFVTAVLDRRSLNTLNLIFPTQIALESFSFGVKGSSFEQMLTGGFK